MKDFRFYLIGPDENSEFIYKKGFIYENISKKYWHNTLQKLYSYKKNKQLLDTLNGPVAPYIKLNRQKL